MTPTIRSTSTEPLVEYDIPANSSSGQRLLTVDAFRAAGFDVVRLLNEPSAAAREYAHRQKRTLTGQREHLLIYDLGGGTWRRQGRVDSHAKMIRKLREI